MKKKVASKKSAKKSVKNIKSLRKSIKSVEKQIGVEVPIIDDLNTPEGRKKYRSKIAQDYFKTQPDGYTAADGYGTQVKTRTFTSTTFDDIVNFPLDSKKLSNGNKSNLIRKEGYHTSRPNFNEPIKFVKDNELLGIDELNKLLDDVDTEFDDVKERSVDNFAPISNSQKETTAKTNRDKVNNANKLFNDLADKIGKITADFWKAKQKLVLANKFMEDFYAGKEFETLEITEHGELFDLNCMKEQLQKAVDMVDGEDSDYKKMILAKIRPDKYKL